MPVHDWSRVGAGIFHDFHGAWITAIRTALNEGLLPDRYYALSESYADDMIADVLTLETRDEEGLGPMGGAPGHPGATAVATAEPKVRIVETAEEDAILARQRWIAIRHSSDDRIIALIEIVSPGNKARQVAFNRFVRKAVKSLRRGWHLLIVDLQPPSPRDPHGIHGAIWPEVGGVPTYRAPEGEPLTLAAYRATRRKKAYIEPIGVGDDLPEMPVFLAPGWYVNVPLGPTYQAAWRGVPRRWRDVLEPPAAG